MEPSKRTIECEACLMSDDGRTWTFVRQTWSLGPNGDVVELLDARVVGHEPIEDLRPYWLPRKAG